MGYYILYTKDTELCVEVEDTIQVEQVQEKIEGLVFVKTEAYTAESVVRAI